MKYLILPLGAFVAIAATQAPAFADTIAPSSSVANVATDDVSTFKLVDANGGTVVGALLPNSETRKLKTIGEANAATAAPPWFNVNFANALTPAQMDAAYNREVDRVFKITHSN